MSLPWLSGVAVCLSPACNVDDRTPVVTVNLDAGANAPTSERDSGVAQSGSGGSASEGPDTNLPLDEQEPNDMPPAAVPPGGACTPLGPPCSGSICIDGLCEAQCDPIRPQAPRTSFAACAAGEKCIAGPLGSSCRIANLGAAEGASCIDDVDCGSGLFCGESGLCRPYCLDSADCAAGVCGLFREPRLTGSFEVGACSTGPCDPSDPRRPREGYSACPPGQNCRSTDTGASYCEAAGTDEFREACAGDSCAPGLFCGSGSLAGVCNHYCIDDTDCATGEICEGFFTPSFAGSLEVGFCASQCDPVNTSAPTPPLTGCETGFACNASGGPGSYCRVAGQATRYETCSSNIDCAAGYACATISDVCVPYCFSNEDCPTGVCNPFSPLQFAGTRSVGHCAEVCDPVNTAAPRAPLASCPAGFRCGAGDADGFSFCGRAGVLRAGETCAESSQCAPGHFCGTGTGTCRQYCYTDADCDSGSCADTVQATAFAGSFSVFTCDP